jgi:hypothetical protein
MSLGLGVSIGGQVKHFCIRYHLVVDWWSVHIHPRLFLWTLILGR